MKTSWPIKLYFLLNLIQLKKIVYTFKIFLFFGDYIQYIPNKFFPLPWLLPDPLPPSYSPNFLFFLSLKAETKEKPRKTHEIQLVLNNYNYSWEWGLSWSVADIASDTLLEKIDFLPQQVSITSCLGVRLCLQLPPPLCAGVFVWFEPV